jgi:hypothetical protein
VLVEGLVRGESRTGLYRDVLSVEVSSDTIPGTVNVRDGHVVPVTDLQLVSVEEVSRSEGLATIHVTTTQTASVPASPSLEDDPQPAIWSSFCEYLHGGGSIARRKINSALSTQRISPPGLAADGQLSRVDITDHLHIGGLHPPQGRQKRAPLR